MTFIPEFLTLSVKGEVVLRAKLPLGRDSRRPLVADGTFRWEDLSRLLNPETGLPFALMAFDEQFYQVEKYELNLKRSRIVIIAGEAVVPTQEHIDALDRWHRSLESDNDRTRRS